MKDNKSCKIVLRKKLELEKQRELELLEIEELMKTMPKHKQYGIGETLIKSRGNRIELCYQTEGGFRESIGEKERLSIKDGKLLSDDSAKTVSVDEINWQKVLAIIKYYGLDTYAETFSNSDALPFDVRNEKFTISMFEANFSIEWIHKSPKGMDVLIEYLENYFNK